MGEMLAIVRDFGGTFEKNTGDGLMAYFGEGSKTIEDAVKPAVEAAVTMHFVNDTILAPLLKSEGFQPFSFRIGIDTGPVTIGKVAIHGGTHGSALAIGAMPNVACKIMKLIPSGGICLGERSRNALPNNWKPECTVATGETGFVYLPQRTPYPAWILNYRAPYTRL